MSYLYRKHTQCRRLNIVVQFAKQTNMRGGMLCAVG
jgi:hypothetical protein